MTVKIATINIVSASTDRAELLAGWLPSLHADVIVLSETSDGKGTTLLSDWFRRQGWQGSIGAAEGTEKGAGVFSRIPFKLLQRPADDPLPWRAVLVELDISPRPLRIVGMYLPNRGKDPAKLQRKTTYMEAWAKHLPQLALSGETLLMGDLNIVPRSQHPRFLPQLEFEYAWLDNLTKAGYVDLSARAGAEHEPTWVAHTGEGYTYDHAFITQHAAARVSGFSYNHESRTKNVSDHSAIVIELDIEAPVTAELLSETTLLPEQPSLFDSLFFGES